MASQDWFEKDFYAVLGVPSGASADEVKKAYRRLARQLHPDANPGDVASERRFKEIGEAYAVLSDPEQRQQYDAVRAMARGGARFSAGGRNGGNGGFDDLFGNLFGASGGAPGGPRMRFTPHPGTAGATGFEDLFNMFGGASGPAGGGMGFRAPGGVPRRGEDLAAETTLTLRQALEGALLNLRVQDPRSGVRTLSTRIPAGVRDGQKVRLRGKGQQGEVGAEPGDLVVTVHIEKHPIFSLDGEDLRVTVPITFAEAALGAQIEAPTLDGTVVRLRVPGGTPSGRVLRVKGRGVHTGRRTGDLLVTVQVVVPQRLDGPAKEAVEALRLATEGEEPRRELLERARREARASSGAGDGR